MERYLLSTNLLRFNESLVDGYVELANRNNEQVQQPQESKSEVR